MDKRNYMELLERFYRGETSKKEESLLLDALKDGPEGIFEEYCRMKWEKEASDEADAAGAGRAEMFARMKTEMMDCLKEKAVRRKTGRRIAGIAGSVAAAAIVALAFFAGYRIAAGGTSGVTTVCADRGQKSSVTLPDGSRVWLNSASSISYSADFNKKDRAVLLDGEAYFEVARNEDRPFVVTASGMSVRALGTAFDVRAYDGEDLLATLVEGKVEVKAGDWTEILCPGEQVSYDAAGNRMEKCSVPGCGHLVPWRNNEMLFENESLEGISRMLERMYDVEVVFRDDAAKESSYTGLVRNNSLQNLLELISETSSVRYTLENGVVTFYLAEK
ncbi:MAG: FecR family protein [Candidatus Cryptobacteroides sp.]